MQSNNTNQINMNSDLIKKYDQMIPRYTSYPTAPVWKEINSDDWQQAINKANENTNPISLYFHIPFCRSACYYCACNIIVSPTGSLTHPYLDALYNEIKFFGNNINANKKVKQIHLGGGTPTYLNPAQLKELFNQISENFELDKSDEREFSIEVDPRVTTKEHLDTLRELGFNRLSMGIQDFNPKVQEAVNRIQSYEMVSDLVNYARSLGYQSINFDLIYGLPHQTVDSFSQTIEQVQELSPDRIALFNYAHLPSLRPFQKANIKEEDLPSADTKINIFLKSIKEFCSGDYEYIGLDHFAKKNNEIAIAYREGKLHRNFQGYTTGKELDLYALGITSISSIGNIYCQNTKKINDYMEYFGTDNLANIQSPPLEKGYILSNEDLQHREMINNILCRGRLDLNQYNISEEEIKNLNILKDDSLISYENNIITVKPTGYIFLRNIAAIFDQYLGKQKNTLFSRSV